MASVHLLIRGKVQGVFYRATAKNEADEIGGITGWVRNTSDGDVEMMVTADEEHLEQFISWCRKGPRKAEVREVVISKVEEQQFNGFQIRH